ncbi:putative cytochrome P450 120 [Oscarella lobularis]|uniref:putative cytochrome P450 120 n=1 Tax=Oscarella lobularis TaxID=121494 RepID=UPI0033140AA4
MARKLPPCGTKFGFLVDESVSFARDPMQYIQKKQTASGSTLFRTRILGKSTVFVTSNDDVRRLLQEQASNYHRSALSHIEDLFGVRSIIFADNDDFARLRSIIQSVVEPKRISAHNALIDSVIDDHLRELSVDGGVALYKTFKALATDLSLALFLGMDGDELRRTSGQFTELTTEHWRGVVSLPVQFKLPFYGKSRFRAAMEARSKLMTEIYDRMRRADETTLLRALADGGFADKEEAAIHVLLFVSALAPKALASLLTSFCLELAKNDSCRERALNDDGYLDDVLLEIERLWPPFLGGRKIATRDFRLGDYVIPQGHSIIYTTFTANRDTSLFPDPEKFNPARWSTSNADHREMVWTFGGGQRGCVGKALSKALVKRCCLYLVKNYTWSFSDGLDLKIKWLPVTRPREHVIARFSKRK